MENLKKILKSLCLTSGVSGFEKESGITDIIINYIRKFGGDAIIDKFGNIITTVGAGKNTVILEAHMDEVGFVVNRTESIIILKPKGIIKGEKVDDGAVTVLGKKIRGRISASGKFLQFIAENKKSKLLIKDGDIVAFERYFRMKSSGMIEGSALDNRVGCSVLIYILSKISNLIFKDKKIIFVFSTKEETDESIFTDVMGKKKDGFAIVTDAAYAQPVEFRTDVPGVKIPIIGEGCAIQVKGKGFSIKQQTIKDTMILAEKNQITTQIESAPRGLGKTNFARILECGIKNGIVINTPVRNQHHQLGITNINDAKSTANLILEIIKSDKFDY